MRRAATVLLAVLTAAAGLPTLLRLVGDHEVRPLAVLVAALPYAALPLLVLLAAHLAVRNRRLIAATSALLLLDAVFFVPLFVGDSAGSGTALTVMTANLRYGQADAATVVRLVRAQHVDVLATEELTVSAVARLRAAGLGTELPSFTGTPDPKEGPDGSGLWSRYPLTALPEWGLRFSSPGAVVHVPGRDVLVRVLHVSPPVVVAGGDYARDVRLVRRDVRALPAQDPTVVLGDLNATVDNSLVRDLEGSRFRDAGEKSGAGWVRTWGREPGSASLLGLDHVLVDGRTGVRGVSVADLPGSDHDALTARLVVRS